MGLDIAQFRELIIKPTLLAVDLWSEAAEVLIAGTAFVESDLSYVKQIHGPAVGVMQMEPATYNDLRTRMILGHADKTKKALDFLAMDMFPFKADFLVGNLYASVMFARFKYYLNKEPLPGSMDFINLAKFYKKIYNTPLGAADINVATAKFKSIVLNYAYH